MDRPGTWVASKFNIAWTGDGKRILLVRIRARRVPRPPRRTRAAPAARKFRQHRVKSQTREFDRSVELSIDAARSRTVAVSWAISHLRSQWARIDAALFPKNRAASSSGTAATRRHHRTAMAPRTQPDAYYGKAQTFTDPPTCSRPPLPFRLHVAITLYVPADLTADPVSGMPM